MSSGVIAALAGLLVVRNAGLATVMVLAGVAVGMFVLAVLERLPIPTEPTMLSLPLTADTVRKSVCVWFCHRGWSVEEETEERLRFTSRQDALELAFHLVASACLALFFVIQALTHPNPWRLVVAFLFPLGLALGILRNRQGSGAIAIVDVVDHEIETMVTIRITPSDSRGRNTSARLNNALVDLTVS